MVAFTRNKIKLVEFIYICVQVAQYFSSPLFIPVSLCMCDKIYRSFQQRECILHTLYSDYTVIISRLKNAVPPFGRVKLLKLICITNASRSNATVTQRTSLFYASLKSYCVMYANVVRVGYESLSYEFQVSEY